MFYFGNRLMNRMIKPELSKYIKESTNKYIENYCNNHKLDKNKSNFTSLRNNTYKSPEKPYTNNVYYLLTFVSLFSFLAGYKFRNLNQKI